MTAIYYLETSITMMLLFRFTKIKIPLQEC